jgi:hypothetical protein
MARSMAYRRHTNSRIVESLGLWSTPQEMAAPRNVRGHDIYSWFLLGTPLLARLMLSGMMCIYFQLHQPQAAHLELSVCNNQLGYINQDDH